MARHRRHGEEDALYLGLDMVCNAFGGIIFITLLLASMPVGRAVINSLAQAPNRATAAQVAERFQLKEAVAQLREKIAIMSRTLNAVSVDPDHTVQERAALQRELNAAAAALRDAVGSSEDLRAKLARELRLIEQRKSVDASLVEMKSELEKQAPAVVQQKRLFRLAPARRSDYFIVLCGGRLYLPMEWNGTTTADNEHDFSIRRIDNTSRSFIPRAEAGRDPAEWLGAADGLARIRELFPNKDFVVHLLVYPDGIGDFGNVLSAFNGAGYLHNWSGIEQGAPFVLFNSPPGKAEAQ